MQINQREYSLIHPLAAELNSPGENNLLFDLDYLTSIELHGKASRDVLQGQLSCDVREVSHTQMRQGALCNLQGRVLALIDVLEANSLCMVLPRDLSQVVVKNIKKPALLARVELQQSDAYQLFGFYSVKPASDTPFHWAIPATRFAFSQQAEGCCWSIGQQLSMLRVEKQYAESLRETFAARNALRGSLAWHARCLQAGLFEIYANTSGLFLPHRLNLHQTGQVHFNKGCYKGQEIIARMHYRSTAKHTIKQFILQTEEPLHAGLKLFEPHTNRELGELIDFCPLTSHHYLMTASILFEHPFDVQIEGQQRMIQLQLAANSTLSNS